MFGRSIFSLAVFTLGTIGIDAQQTPPEGSTNIGTVGFDGAFTDNGNGNWLVTGSGSDIWGSYDHFHYAHFNRTADVTVTCLVNDFTGSDNSWRKGGIMFRNHLGSRSPHSMIQVTGWGISHQSRNGETHGSTSYHDSYSTSNVWLRLVKQGNTITSYVKRDGEYDFMQFHTIDTVDLGESFYVGLAVTSHDNNVLATLDVSNFEIADEIFSLPAEPHEIGDTGEAVWVQEYGPDMWSIHAGGDGIGGTKDSFGFFDQKHTGNIVADLHLEKLTRRTNDSKGGLMIRASHAVDAPHVSLLVTAKDGVTMFVRPTAGAETSSTNVGVWHEDVELRLEKTGNSVKCMYKHATAPEWFEIGTVTAELDDGAGSYHVGQAVSSADYGDHSRLTTGALVVTQA